MHPVNYRKAPWRRHVAGLPTTPAGPRADPGLGGPGVANFRGGNVSRCLLSEEEEEEGGRGASAVTSSTRDGRPRTQGPVPGL